CESTLTLCENPLMSTLFLDSSHISQELSFHTCVAMLYSSIRGSCGKCNTQTHTHTHTHPRHTHTHAQNRHTKTHTLKIEIEKTEYSFLYFVWLHAKGDRAW